MGFARHEDLMKGWRLAGSAHRVGCNSWGVPGVGMGCVWAEDAPIRRLQPMIRYMHMHARAHPTHQSQPRRR
jgi:hypothetical protein